MKKYALLTIAGISLLVIGIVSTVLVFKTVFALAGSALCVVGGTVLLNKAKKIYASFHVSSADEQAAMRARQQKGAMIAAIVFLLVAIAIIAFNMYKH
ncbi:hypothetical protein [Filimonas effusa]|uniref:Uncharacterized protein n=1 Tax=Filimonas effusa TaxID=2508721 RepID=A0A4Q1DC84_9BACT|nr:hypothetical protein [Filimonas effusa]RXK87124.1 hypothetical protein ESB13_10180 [Filimonas effusa]